MAVALCGRGGRGSAAAPVGNGGTEDESELAEHGVLLFGGCASQGILMVASSPWVNWIPRPEQRNAADGRPDTDLSRQKPLNIRIYRLRLAQPCRKRENCPACAGGWIKFPSISLEPSAPPATHSRADWPAMQTTSDEVLIARIAGGDRLAMQVLFARHHVRVYRFVLRLVRNEATAEDLISEVFLDVWRQAESSRAARRSRPGC